MASPRILFLVNGLGLGNSTRCHAVIQRLLDAGATIRIMTSGNGIWYFGNMGAVKEIQEMESLYYGAKHGRLSVFRTVLALADFFRIIRRNSAKLARFLDEWRPDVAVIDSVYTFLPLKKRGIRIVALNNADVVHVAYRRFTDRPRSIRAQFWLVEELDYLYHRMVADLVISPNLDAGLPETGGNACRVGPIVRAGYAPSPGKVGVQRVLVMLSGSRFGSPVMFSRLDWPYRIDVVGRPAPDGWTHETIHFHGKLLDNRELVHAADLVVINGGFSAVSESFAMRKPMVVVPVPNHAEQWINGRTMVKLGVGMMAEEDAMEDAIETAVWRIEDFRAAYLRIGAIPDGTGQAAEAILRTAGTV